MNPSALGALWAQVSEALPGLFVPLAESVMEVRTQRPQRPLTAVGGICEFVKL